MANTVACCARLYSARRKLRPLSPASDRDDGPRIASRAPQDHGQCRNSEYRAGETCTVAVASRRLSFCAAPKRPTGNAGFDLRLSPKDRIRPWMFLARPWVPMGSIAEKQSRILDLEDRTKPIARFAKSFIFAKTRMVGRHRLAMPVAKRRANDGAIASVLEARRHEAPRRAPRSSAARPSGMTQ